MLGGMKKPAKEWKGGKRLLAARKAKGLSQDALGRLAGLWATQVSHWEAGRHKPSRASLARLADALGVSVGYLTDGVQ